MKQYILRVTTKYLAFNDSLRRSRILNRLCINNSKEYTPKASYAA